MSAGGAAREGPPVQRLARSRHGGHRRAQDPALGDAALNARLASEKIDVTLPRARSRRARPPVSQVLDEITAIFADLGFRIAEGPDVEFDDYNFTKLNIPARSSRAPDARHFLCRAAGGWLAPCAAHAYEPGAGAHDAGAEAADPRDRTRAAPIATIPTRRTRRCSISSKRW
jgi:hypothetical protein